MVAELHSLISKESEKILEDTIPGPSEILPTPLPLLPGDRLYPWLLKPKTSVNLKDRPWMQLVLLHLRLPGRCCERKGEEQPADELHRLRCLGQSLQLWTASHGSQPASPDTIPAESTQNLFPVPILLTPPAPAAGRPVHSPFPTWWRTSPAPPLRLRKPAGYPRLILRRCHRNRGRRHGRTTLSGLLRRGLKNNNNKLNSVQPGVLAAHF